MTRLEKNLRIMGESYLTKEAEQNGTHNVEQSETQRTWDAEREGNGFEGTLPQKIGKGRTRIKWCY